MATVRGGQAVLAVLQMPTGTIQMERAFADLDQIYSPTWSPDGTRIVFSALHGGSTDLYEFDVARRGLRRLTTTPTPISSRRGRPTDARSRSSPTGLRRRCPR